MSKPTKEDASLFLQIFSIMKNDEVYQKAVLWSLTEFKVKDYEEFKKKYPIGSDGYKYMFNMLEYAEVVGILINNDVLSEDLIYDSYGDMYWEKVKDIVHGMRKDWGRPRLYENYEIIAKKYSNWAESHPAKL